MNSHNQQHHFLNIKVHSFQTILFAKNTMDTLKDPILSKSLKYIFSRIQIYIQYSHLSLRSSAVSIKKSPCHIHSPQTDIRHHRKRPGTKIQIIQPTPRTPIHNRHIHTHIPIHPIPLSRRANLAATKRIRIRVCPHLCGVYNVNQHSNGDMWGRGNRRVGGRWHRSCLERWR